MSYMSDNRHAFVIQLWCEKRETEGAIEQWRGIIEHIPSGQRDAVTTIDDIAQFINNHVSLKDSTHTSYRSLRTRLRRHFIEESCDEDQPPTE